MAAGAPDEKIEALVIFFTELPMLLVTACWESEEGCQERSISINHTVDPKLEKSDKIK